MTYHPIQLLIQIDEMVIMEFQYPNALIPVAAQVGPKTQSEGVVPRKSFIKGYLYLIYLRITVKI